ncbi:hypothetical protein [uncultured Lutibacter sp.]|uniref:hypothetical protein n=1 Tax=uncultured Lutibacter sp. TaxID=437739 RepID=UPI002621F3EB|nr:hypothetical protein [uncultured Lutibacter sp.]
MKTKIKKEWPGKIKGINELHNNSKKWLSEIEFTKYEIQFLSHLLSSKYIDYLDSGLFKKISEFSSAIFNKKKDFTDLKELVLEHEKTLSNLINQNAIVGNTNYLATHEKIGKEINITLKDYKNLKLQIFDIVEGVMRLKDQKKLA